jgi:hypothetical protein
MLALVRNAFCVRTSIIIWLFRVALLAETEITLIAEVVRLSGDIWEKCSLMRLLRLRNHR